MQNKVLIAGGILIFGLTGWNSLTMYRLEQRMTVFESVVSKNMAVAKKSSSKTEATAKTDRAIRALSMKQNRRGFKAEMATGDGENTNPVTNIDLENPEVREAIAQIVEEDEYERESERREERVGMYLDSVRKEVKNFANEHDLDEPTTLKVMAEIERSTKEYSEVRAQVKDGEISWFDARKDFKKIKEEGAVNLKEIVGEEKYEDLRERIWGGWR